MLTGSKYALSRNTLVVLSEIPESWPPNTPAIHIGSSALQIIRSAADKVRSTPSRVTNFCPSVAFLTTTFPPLILSASNECKACPISWSTKLVTSTTLLIGRIPMVESAFFNQSGDSLIVTPLMLTPV